MMKKTLYFFFYVWASTLALAADPCKTDFKNPECFSELRTAIFFANGKTDSFSIKYKNFLKTYNKKYGIEGYLYSPNERTESVAENVLRNHVIPNPLLKERVLRDLPKGTLFRGKNIFQVMIENPNTIEAEVHVENLNLLFPAEGNEDLKLTSERWGLPWDDQKFLAGYVSEVEELIREIERTQDFFKYDYREKEKHQYLVILKRLKPFAKIPDEVCQSKTLDELNQYKAKYPEMFTSAHKDIPLCLIKNNKCDLAMDLVNSGDFPAGQMPVYFNQLATMKATSSCAEMTKDIYLKMLDDGSKSNNLTAQKGRLGKLPDYLNLHPELSPDFCDAPVGGSLNNLQSLEKGILDVMNHQSFDLMEKILAESDEKKRDELITQFVEHMKLIGKDAVVINAKTKKSFLEMMADAGAHEVFGKIRHHGITTWELGSKGSFMEKEPLLEKLILSEDINKLKFAYILYNAERGDDSTVYVSRKALKRLRSKNPVIKEYKDMFKGVVHEHYIHIY
jgi:hypothetical protein